MVLKSAMQAAKKMLNELIIIFMYFSGFELNPD